MQHCIAPLLVIADLPSNFRLADLRLNEQDGQSIRINTAKYQGLDMCEIILDGITFTLRHHNAEEILANPDIGALRPLFCDTPSQSSTAISIALGENMADGKHIPAVNRAYLRLALRIGNNVAATHAAWLPAGQITGFDYFSGPVTDYLNGGPLPVAVQIAITENGTGRFETTGLDYFAGQDIRLETPDGFPANEAIKRLVRIAHDIATNGKIDGEIKTSGMAKSEQLLFRPSEDGRYLYVSVNLPETSRVR